MRESIDEQMMQIADYVRNFLLPSLDELVEKDVSLSLFENCVQIPSLYQAIIEFLPLIV